MRIVYFGHHNAGVKCLEYLVKEGEEISAVVTHPADPGENVWYGSVKEKASSHGLEVLEPDNLKDRSFTERLKELQPDVIFLVSFRKMIHKEIINLPQMGCINLHDSLLPKYRGFTPCTWVIINGEKETGVTMLYADEGVDSGDIISQKKITISETDTGYTLNQKLAEASYELFKETFPKIKNGTAARVPQDHPTATYGKRRRPEDGLISWDKTSGELYDWVRALTRPYPGAFTFYNGRKLFVWKVKPTFNPAAAVSPGQILEIDGMPAAGTKDGAVLLEEVQFESGALMQGREICRLGLKGILGE